MNSKIMILWGTIIVLICSTLIVLGNNQGDKDLLRLKRNIKESYVEYLKDKELMPSFNKTYTIKIDKLIEEGYLGKTNTLDEYCIKEVTIKKGIIVNNYEFNIKCDEVIKEG